MDQLDRAILNHLQHEGRLPNNELADRVGLSPSPCLRRVRALEEQGVITGYGAIVSPAEVGRSYEALVWVTLTEINRPSMLEFEDCVATLVDVIEAYRMFGQPDYLLRVAVADLTAFEQTYTDGLASLPFVRTLTTQLTMKTIKRSHILPA
jgi:Lrp/AsnC family transcriptional regulator, leucine-responsive regulatory protein